jgi:hypothetical protein
MKIVTISLIVAISAILNAQVKSVIPRFPLNALYYDNYGTFDNIKFFHNQSLINFTKSEENALVSFYSNTSKSTYDKYVIINGKREVIYHIGSDTKGKVDSVIYNDFDSNLSNQIQALDTSQSWIDIYFKLQFKYNEENLSIVSYEVVKNGRPQGRDSERFIIKNEKIKGLEHHVFYIDRREDRFLNNLTSAIGNLKKNTVRILLGIDPPETQPEKELFELITTSGESLELNTLVDLYSKGDKRLMQFYKL